MPPKGCQQNCNPPVLRPDGGSPPFVAAPFFWQSARSCRRGNRKRANRRPGVCRYSLRRRSSRTAVCGRCRGAQIAKESTDDRCPVVPGRAYCPGAGRSGVYLRVLSHCGAGSVADRAGSNGDATRGQEPSREAVPDPFLCYFVNFPPMQASDSAAVNLGRRAVGQIAHRATPIRAEESLPRGGRAGRLLRGAHRVEPAEPIA